MADEKSGRSGRGTLRRWLIVLGVVVVVVVVALAVVVSLVVDPEQHRERIELALEQSTGWEASLGAVDLSLWGGVALDVHPASLEGPGPDSSRFAIGELSVRASLLPLLSGTLRIDSVVLEAPEIVLVRETESEGWMLPGAAGTAGEESGGSEAAGEEAGAMALLIDRIDVADGRLLLVDRAVSPARELELADLDVSVQVSRGVVNGSARLEQADVTFDGTWPDELSIGVSGLPTATFAMAPGGDLVLPGGSVSGEIVVNWPDAVSGDLTARALSMLAGTEPLEEATATFRVTPSAGEPGGWALESLEVRAGEALLTGGGSLVPSMALRMSVDKAPVEDAVRALRALAPVPVDIEGPGEASVKVRVDAPPEGEVDIRVDGEATAGVLRIGGPLPEATDVAAGFSITGTERLTIDIDRGTVAGGPLTGKVVIEPLVPPGEMRFEGNVKEARFGGLLVGFVGEKVEGLEGPTSLDADIRLDLSGEEIDPLALVGAIDAETIDVKLPGWDLEGALRSRLEEKLGSLGALVSMLDVGGGSGREAGGSEESKAPEGEGLLERVVASVELERDTWKLNPVRIISGDLTARGQGDFRPGDGSVDLALEAQLDPEATKTLVAEHGGLRYLVNEDGSLSLPLAISGPMTSPKIGFDVSSLVPKEQGKKKLKDAIKGLFKDD